MAAFSPMVAAVMHAMANRGGAGAAPVIPGVMGAPQPPMPGVPPGLPSGAPPPGIPVQPGGVSPSLPGPGMPPTALPDIRPGGAPLGAGGDAGNPAITPQGSTPAQVPVPPPPHLQPWEIQDQGNGTAVIRVKGPNGQLGPVVKVIRIKRQENELHQQQLQHAQ